MISSGRICASTSSRGFVGTISATGSRGPTTLPALVAGYGSDLIDGEGDSDTYRITARGGSITDLTIAYDSGGVLGSDTLIFVGTAETDTVLLRAMADSYVPMKDKLDALIDKYFFSGEADKLAAIRQAIEDAYGPHDLPAGMIADLTTEFRL